MDKLAEIRRPIEQELADYQQLFRSLFATEDALLAEALNHVRQRSGKMMRPMLVLLMAKAFEGVTEKSHQCAAVLELLHTASLLHDDVVDESDERRGQPSLNAVQGNRVAILVGDFMLSCALHVAALTGDLSVVDFVANLGATLSAGEVKQIENTRSNKYDESAYFHVIKNKTASLFATCARFGAMTGNASPEMLEKAVRVGELIGICFQIRDDIFDYYADGKIGKPTGNDMAEGKLTLPALYALQHTDDDDLHARAAHVKAGTATPDDIATLVDFTKRAGGIEYARDKMLAFHAEAADILDTHFQGPVGDALRAYLDYTVERDN